MREPAASTSPTMAAMSSVPTDSAVSTRLGASSCLMRPSRIGKSIVSGSAVKANSGADEREDRCRAAPGGPVEREHDRLGEHRDQRPSPATRSRRERPPPARSMGRERLALGFEPRERRVIDAADRAGDQLVRMARECGARGCRGRSPPCPSARPRIRSGDGPR